MISKSRWSRVCNPNFDFVFSRETKYSTRKKTLFPINNRKIREFDGVRVGASYYIMMKDYKTCFCLKNNVHW